MTIHEIRDSRVHASPFRMDDADGFDYVVQQVCAHGLGTYEAPYPTMVAKLVRSLPGIHLDVGANTGLFTLLMAASHPTAHVVAFEPLQSIGRRLRKNLALNPELATRIRVESVALSDRRGETAFFETVNPHGLLTTSSGLDQDFSGRHGKIIEHRMSTITLDDWARTNSVHEIGFIKLDVEGHETSVMRGAVETIVLCRPVLGVEILGNSQFDRVAEWLVECDYIDCEMTPDGIAFSAAPRFVDAGWNHLFIPTERAAMIIDTAAEVGLPFHDRR